MRSNIGFKVSLVGQSGVGKTCLLTRYIKGIFNPKNVTTIGANFLTKELVIQNTHITLNIRDTAGQELYRSLTPMYYRNAAAAIVIFDVTSVRSFETIKEWVSELRANERDILIYLCGNKIDLVDQRQITTTQIENLAEELNIKFTETSAFDGNGIDQLFYMIANDIMKSDQFFEYFPKEEIENKNQEQESSCC